MEQEPLFFEDIFDCIRHACHKMGGLQKVGHTIRPKLSPPKAGEWLANCLNRTRPEKLDLEDFLLIKREAKATGCHVIAAFENQDSGYAPPQPIEPEDEKAELRRKFVESVAAQKKILDRLEQIA